MERNNYQRMRNYPSGSRVQHTTKYIFIKQKEGGWIPEHRWLAQDKLVGRPLEPGERVFHRNGVRDDNDISNLVIVKYNTTKFIPMKHSIVLFIPHIKNPLKLATTA